MTKPLAVVTGGSSGIGRYLVEALLRNNYAVAYTYVVSAADPGAPAGSELRPDAPALAVRCDAGRKDEVDAFYAQARDWHGSAPALLVNNAGIQTWSSLLELEEDGWDNVIRTNLKGCFLNIQAAARLMKDAGGGAIVNIGSGCNKMAFPNLVSYSASKGGIEQLTKSAAIELGRFGIRVNCVAPGAIIVDRTLQEDPHYEQKWAPLTPLGRTGQPGDVSDVVLFFASAAARFVTGQTLWVDGGLFSRPAWPYTD